MGNGSVKNALAMQVPPMYINDIFISHLHGDHYADLPYMYPFTAWAGRWQPLRLYGPSGATPELGIKHMAKHMREMLDQHAVAFVAGATGCAIGAFAATTRVRSWALVAFALLFAALGTWLRAWLTGADFWAELLGPVGAVTAADFVVALVYPVAVSAVLRLASVRHGLFGVLELPVGGLEEFARLARHDFDVVCAEAQRSAAAVHRGIAHAYNKYVFANSLHMAKRHRFQPFNANVDILGVIASR